MDNKKLILILALLGGGYLIWRNSKVAAQSVGTTPADLPSDVPQDIPADVPADIPVGPKSQKDCPEGYLFVPLNCAMPPCEGGRCVEPKIEPKPMVDIVAIPDPSSSPRFELDPFTEFLTPKPLPELIKDPYSQIFTTQVEFAGFSFAGTDKNTLALQEDTKQSSVRQSNFN